MPSILVADDDGRVRRFLRTVLEGGGHKVWEASNGKEAKALIFRTKFDVVIIDLAMPEGEGLETIQALRKEHPDLRMIAISGSIPAVLRIAERLGAIASLSKPFSAETVLETVQRVLGIAKPCPRAE
jgi:CheY-like chemotaxis protein